MSTWMQATIIITCCGALGGITNCGITGEFVLPKWENGAWRPGWIGNVVIGATAAIVVGLLYGPLGRYDVFGNADQALTLQLSELAGAIVVGLGGGNILTQLAKNQFENIAKNTLISSLATLTSGSPSPNAQSQTGGQAQADGQPQAGNQPPSDKP